MTAVFSTRRAYAALKEGGKLITWGQGDAWGHADMGGDSRSVVFKLQNGVTAVFSNGFAFAALKNGGKVITWGHADYGENSRLGAVRAVYP